MHNDILSDDLRVFRDLTRTWVEREIAPFHSEWEQSGLVPREVYQKAGAQGLLCLTQAEKYGGLGVDFRFAAVVIEELARINASGVAFYLHSDIVAPYIEEYGTEGQKAKYLPRMARGEWIGAIAMTEPGAGSDLQGIKATARKEKDHWVLNGQKTFISNGQCSDLVIVAARTENPAFQGKKYAPLTLFLVESSFPGFHRGQSLKKIGYKAQDTAEMFFQDCRVPHENLLGQEGEAFTYLMKQLGRERLCMAIWSAAQSRAVLSETIGYVKERKMFGQSLADFQNTKFKLAEMDTEISVGEAFVDRCIQQMLQGRDVGVDASKAKYWCSETLGRVVDQCLQLHGGYGYMEEYPVSKAFVDARILRIFGGTSEIMKEIVARQLLKD
jgi:acyl-CoA dehydrogenase